jgi:uncharacterized protein YbjT (DUF2867 family)
MAKPTVVIAGATGFVGRALLGRLAEEFQVVGLTRDSPARLRGSGVAWRRCDLFSLMQTERALAGAECACYLVHSMLPSAHLTQGTFQDMDLIMADNFARAAAGAGVRQIVYLGGLVPEGVGLSRHLQSRLEVEQTLASRRVPVTSLRAGIIIGAGGSSYRLFKTLVERLPVIPCSRWGRSLTQPVALADVLALIRHCLLRPAPASRACDIGSPDVMSYRELLARTAVLLGLRRTIVDLPVTGTFWCRHWLHLATGMPLELVAPLLESMRHSMVARERRLQAEAGIPGRSFEQAVREALAEERRQGTAIRTSAERALARRMDRRVYLYHVRSVQRVPLPPGGTARWAAERYLEFLPRLFRVLLRTERGSDGVVRFLLPFPRVSLLDHLLAADRSGASDRQVFYITGGILARRVIRKTLRPRLEFREVLGGTALLAAIHDYRPRLPWLLYSAVQAKIHLMVMRLFARDLRRAAPPPRADVRHDPDADHRSARHTS